MKEKISQLAKRIQDNRDSLKEKARELRDEIDIKDVDNKNADIDLSIGAVDGGILTHRIHGVDITLTRSSGVIFDYKNGELDDYSYIDQEEELDYRSGLDERSSQIFYSLSRLKSELSCALRTVDSCDMLLMDGSLLPLPSTKSNKNSDLYDYYKHILNLYDELLDHNVVGVIKDSRSCKLAKESGFTSSDSVLCNYMLKKGERTTGKSYFKDKAPPEMKDLGKDIKFFYLKVSDYDIPLRIEYKEGNDVGDVIYSLSDISKEYAYPAVLVEADMRASFDTQDKEMLESSLSNLESLRRHDRPFR